MSDFQSLVRWGGIVHPMILEALKSPLSPEARAMFDEALKYGRAPLRYFPNEHLRLVRGIEALELMGGELGRRVLNSIGTGSSISSLAAREATAALERLQARDRK